MSGAANQATITAFLASKGLTANQIAGIEGNLKVESGFDPTNNKGDGGTSWGIAQWHLGRRDALVRYAAARGKPWTDLQTQLDYLWSELSGPYKKSTLDPLSAPGITAAQAATVFDRKFEGSTLSSLPLRVKYANQIAAGGVAGAAASGGPNLIPVGVSNVGLLGGSGGLIPGSGASVLGGVVGDGVSAVTSAAAGAAGSAFEAAAGSKPVKQLFFQGFTVLIAGGLVMLGLYKAFSPQIKSVAGKVSNTAGSAAKLAAL